MILNETLCKLVANETVTIIGGASEPPVHSKGLIVRFNDHFFKQQGLTDILYYDAKGGAAEFDAEPRTKHLKFVNIQLFQDGAKDIAELLKSLGIPWAYYGAFKPGDMQGQEIAKALPKVMWPMEIIEQLGFFPLTGLLSIFHLALHGCDSFIIENMDFYRRQNGTFPNAIGPHHIRNNAHALTSLMKMGIVTPSSYVNSALSQLFGEKKKDE